MREQFSLANLSSHDAILASKIYRFEFNSKERYIKLAFTCANYASLSKSWPSMLSQTHGTNELYSRDENPRMAVSLNKETTFKAALFTCFVFWNFFSFPSLLFWLI